MSYEDYFKGCSNEREYKLRFTTLAKKHHPDKGGDLRVMQEINRQYDTIKKNGWRNYGGAKVDSDFEDAFRYAASGAGFARARPMWGEWDWDDIYQKTKREFEESIKRENQRQQEAAKRAYEEQLKFEAWLTSELTRCRELLEKESKERVIEMFLKYQEKNLRRALKRSKDKGKW